MRKAITFNSKQEALDMAEALSKELGYPKSGTPINGGIHVPPELAITTGFGVHERPDKAAYAITLTDEVVSLGIKSVDIGRKTVDIDASKASDLGPEWKDDQIRTDDEKRK